MKPLFISILILISGITTAQWVQQTSNTQVDLHCVNFFNENIGFAGGSVGLIKTYDGGNTWTQVVFTGTTGTYLGGNTHYAVQVLSPSKIVSAGVNFFDDNESIILSNDSGKTWSIVHSGPYMAGLRDMKFISSTTGYAVGEGGRILKTTDGGNSWSLTASGTTNELSAITFANSSIGYITGDKVILRTLDGGSTWNKTTVTYWGNEIVAVDDSIAFISANQGIYRTTNYGTSWSLLSLPFNSGLIHAFSLNDLLVAGTKMYSTVDGIDWYTQPSFPSGANILKMFFVNNSVGYAVGYSGRVVKTNNRGGATLPLLNFTANNNNICQDSTITFMNQSLQGYNYSWYLNGNLHSTSYNTDITFNQGGYDTVTLTVSDGTYSESKQTAIFVKTNYNVVPFTLDLLEDTTCLYEYDTIVITNILANQTYGVFINGSSSSSNLQAVINQGNVRKVVLKRFADIGGQGYYNIRVSAAPVNPWEYCYSAYELFDTFVVDPKPLINLPVSATEPAVCHSDSTTIQIQNTQPGVDYELRIKVNTSFPATGNIIAGNGGTIFFNTGRLTSNTIYSVYAKNSFGCQAYQLTQIVTVSISVVDASFSTNKSVSGVTTIAIGDTLKIINTSIGDNYNWNFGPDATPSNSNVPAATTVYQNTGYEKEIKLIITTNIGCIDSSSLFIDVFDTSDFNIDNLCSAQVIVGSDYTTDILDVFVDHDDNVYYTGYKTVYAGGGASNKAMFVTKYDSIGNKLWEMTPNLTSNYVSSFATSVFVDSEGNVYVTGNFTGRYLYLGSGTLSHVVYGGGSNTRAYAGYVVKLDSSGNYLWHNMISTNSYSGFTDLVYVNHEKIYISAYYPVGYYEFSNYSGYNNTINGAGMFQIFQINDNGDLLKSLSGNSLVITPPNNITSTYIKTLFNPNSGWYTDQIATLAPKIKLSKNGKLIVVGSFSGDVSIGNFQLDTIGLSVNGFIAVLDTQLFAWDNAFTTYALGSNNIYHYSASGIMPSFDIDESNHIYQHVHWAKSNLNQSTGYFILNNGLTFQSIAAGMLMKFDLNGNLLWQNRSNSNRAKSNIVRSINYVNDDNIILFGDFTHFLSLTSQSLIEQSIISTGLGDVFIASYNSNGNLNWIENIGGLSEDRAYSSFTSKCGEVYFAGYLLDTIRNSGITLIGDFEHFYGKFSSTGNCNIQSCSDLSLYANASLYCSGNIGLGWQSTPDYDSISITFSPDSGATWLPVTGSVINNDSYTFTLPNGLPAAFQGLFVLTGFPSNTSDSVWVTIAPSISLNYTAQNDTLNCSGSITFSVTGGTQPFSYHWSDSSLTGSQVNDLCAGQYLITVTDAFGCESDTLINILYTNSITALVWPGDANDDLTANNNDLLNIGLYYGISGTTRDSVSNLWIGHNSLNWNDTMYNGSNLNHADCNGDGTINDADTLAINLNYGLTHVRSGNMQSRAGEPLITLVPNKSTYLSGDTVIIDMVLGDAINPVTNLYGMAFDITFNNSVAETGTVQLYYIDGFLGNVSDNLKFSKIFEQNGKADGAITRKNQQNANGYGTIASLQFIAKNTTGLPVNTGISIGNYYALNATADSVIFDTQNSTASFTVDAITGITAAQNQFQLTAYPNPYTQSTTIQYTLAQTANTTLRVYDVLGKVLMQTQNTLQPQGTQQIQFNNAANGKGIYIVELTVNGSKTIKRIVQVE